MGPNTYWHVSDDWNEEQGVIAEDYSNNVPGHVVRNCVAIGNKVGFNNNNSFRKQYWYNNFAYKNILEIEGYTDDYDNVIPTRNVEKNYVIYRQFL